MNDYFGPCDDDKLHDWMTVSEENFDQLLFLYRYLFPRTQRIPGETAVEARRREYKEKLELRPEDISYWLGQSEWIGQSGPSVLNDLKKERKQAVKNSFTTHEQLKREQNHLRRQLERNKSKRKNLERQIKFFGQTGRIEETDTDMSDYVLTVNNILRTKHNAVNRELQAFGILKRGVGPFTPLTEEQLRSKDLVYYSREPIPIKRMLDEKFVGQGIFGELSEIPENVNGTLNAMTNSFTSFSLTSENLSNVMRQLTDFLKAFTPNDDLDPMIILSSLHHLLLSYRQRSVVGFMLGLKTLTGQLGLTYSVICNAAGQLLGEVSAAFVGQSLDLVMETIFKDSKMHHIGVAGSIIVSIIGALFCAGPTKGLSKYVADFGRVAIGWDKASSLFEWIKRTALDVYYTQTAGISLEQKEMEEKYPRILALTAKVEMLMSTDFDIGYLDNSKELAEAVVQLDNDLDSYRTMAMRAGDKKLSAVLSSQIHRLALITTAARNSSAKHNSRRIAPLTTYIYGRPGTGKSNLVDLLKAHIYKNEFTDSNWTQQNISYNRVVENDYWDGFLVNQPIVIYDDILQTKDTIAMPNPEIMEIIRIKNEAPYQLHMAAVADKKNHFFNAKHVLATSNVRIPSPVSISDKTAFTRRWDIAIEVKVLSEYGKLKGVQGDAYYAVDDSKLPRKGEFCKEIYDIDVYNLADGTVISQGMNLDDFLVFYDKAYKNQVEKTERLTSSINKLVGLETVTKPDHGDFTTKFIAQAGRKPAETGNTRTEFTETSNKFDVLDDECEAEIVEMATLMENAMTPPDSEFKDAVDTELTPDEILVEVLRIEQAAKPKSMITEWISKAKLSTRYNAFKNYLAHSKIKDLISSGLSKISMAGRWLYALFTNTKWSLLIMAASMACIAGLWVGRMACPLVLDGTTDDFLISVIENTHDCDFCHPLKNKTTLKEIYDGIQQNLLGASVIQNQPGTDKALIRISTELIERHITDQIDERIKNANLIREQFMSCESKETKTRNARSSFVQESKETRTRHPLARFVQESKETKTRQAKSNFAAEGVSNEQTHEQWEHTTYNNSAVIVCSRSTACGVFVAGRVFMTVAHVLSGDSVKVLKPNHSQGNTYAMKDLTITHMTDLNGDKTDLVLVTLPNETTHRNIIQKFAVSEPIMQRKKVILSGLRQFKGNALINQMSAPGCDIWKSMSYTVEGREIPINTGIVYEMDTKAGDCGSLLYTTATQSAGKIIGMHVAGSTGKGMSYPVSRAFIQRNMDLHAVDTPRRHFTDATTDFEGQGLPKTDSLETLGNCSHFAYVEPLNVSSVTQLSPSILSGTLQEPDTKPAYLKPVEIQGELVDPMVKGIKKIMTYSNGLDDNLLQMASDDVEHLLKKDLKEPLRVFTYEEAVRGIEGRDMISPLNRKTSPGYPYTKCNPATGKHHWFGYGDDYVINEEIRRDVNEVIECCKNNVRPAVIWTATLKDERRPIAKVEEGKTRVFTAGPQHYTLAVRQYFLNFIEHIMINRIKNEIGVGTNPYGMDWHQTALALQSKGSNVIAGDFSNFDGSLRQDVLWKICDIINACYNDGTENANIREGLFTEILNARILVRGEIIQCDHSQPSGNPLTVIVNSIFNMIVMRMSYLLLLKERNEPVHLLDFRKHVSMQTYGDDNCLNISAEIIDWYNQQTITKALSTIGLTYTDEGKTGELVKARTLSEIAYLKRSFVRDNNGIFKGPLSYSVCLEMTNWIRGNREEIVEASFENCKASLQELTLHGQKSFNEARTRMEPHFVDYEHRLPTYAECVSILSRESPVFHY
jgi:hypothetical protein